MPENTEYSMSPDDAMLIAGIGQHGLDARRTMVKDVMTRHGPERLVELLAQLIGMANSVAANCAEMSDTVLINECGVHPDKFDSVNLPTIFGACQGVKIAHKCDAAGACHGCAYRLGSIANQSPITTSDAEFMAHDRKGFMCHAELDERGEPLRVCVGHAKAARAST
ncbi:hypothetical protein IRZ81_14585 [Pseudomonas putida]|uniref:hypothetical protein n=1 Tax=Pseudomonas putida TaxID=303 RepID=UPI0018A90BB1|nr:hypothetical protein [Pseudomonas putida]MBF8652022.1 hypothetical protein [Pseudomonas putida]MBF8655974.1 hypothetical protein [Pseudomonas putida]